MDIQHLLSQLSPVDATEDSKRTQSLLISAAKQGISFSAAHRNALRDAQLGTNRAPRDTEWAQKHGASKSANHRAAETHRCSVDGVTWYPTLKDLKEALGTGKQGTRHPNFRYADPVLQAGHLARMEREKQHLASLPRKGIHTRRALPVTCYGIRYESKKAAFAAHGRCAETIRNMS